MKESTNSRILPLDALRGLIMVLMALDHANHFVAQQHSAGEYWGGSFPRFGDALAFLTRLVTHLSAPGFFFLMGAGMLLFANSRRKQGWGERAIVGHFLARGGLLIGLQLLIVNRAWELSPGGWGPEIYVGVLFALGGTMILGSPLLWLKPKALLPLTVAFVLAAELLTPAPGQWNQTFSPLVRLLLVPGGDLALWVNYPVLPWLELVSFGILFGHWLVNNRLKAFERALKLGTVFLLTFFALRALDGFGNIRPRAGDTWIDFLNVVKYPPSITFNLLAMGANLILLGLFARMSADRQRFLRPLAVFGQAPLFFYLTHLFLYAGLGLWLTPHGTSIPKMYPYWLLGLLILYPLCWGYGWFKHRQPANSIYRFF
ncbi:MAG: DUF1624 domain-containing protein [Chloroflexi bacterium]|nr:DUF1624 domain-containing protein [Chloroflexota bacterium]